jgi:ribonuclease HI
MKTLSLYFDGSYGPKFPDGTASYAFSIPEFGIEDSGKIGSGPGYSVNYAEFYALHKGLSKIEQLVFPEHASVFANGDSQLVINIMKGRWRTSKNKLYYPAYELVVETYLSLSTKGINVDYNWIPREQNTKTDKLSKYQNFK